MCKFGILNVNRSSLVPPDGTRFLRFRNFNCKEKNILCERKSKGGVIDAH